MLVRRRVAEIRQHTVAHVLSIPTGDRHSPLNLTAQKRKEKTLHAQLAQVEGLVARQPVLMVWEDVQWSDPTTRALALNTLALRLSLRCPGCADKGRPAVLVDVCGDRWTTPVQ